MLTFPNVTPEVFALVLDQLRTEATVEQVSSNGYMVNGHHWALGHIRTSVTFDGSLVTVIVLQPERWEDKIGGRIRDAITLAQQAVAKAGQGGVTAA